MFQTAPFAEAPLLPATCLHAALFPKFSGLEVPECPPYSALQKPGPNDSAPCLLVNLPFSPQEARACLAELRSLSADALSQELHRTVEHMSRANLPEHEAAALARFSGTSGMSETSEISRDAATDDARLRQAQTLLLMVWVQEERVLEIAELSRRYARGEKKLTALLGDTNGDTDGDTDTNTVGNTDGDTVGDPAEALDPDLLALLPAWPFVLELLSLFLPENAVLCVTHPGLAAHVQESDRLAAGAHGLSGRFGLHELSRRPGTASGEYLFILPPEVLA